MEMGRILLADINQNKEPSGADEALEGSCAADFSGGQPRRIGLGHPLGRDPSRKIEAAISRGEFRGS